jgi:hypothetical protein
LNLKKQAGQLRERDLIYWNALRLDKWQIVRQGPNLTNYWVLHVPKDIIPGHGPIFEGESRDVMAALFRLAQTTQAAERARPVSVKASRRVRCKKQNNGSSDNLRRARRW